MIKQLLEDKNKDKRKLIKIYVYILQLSNGRYYTGMTKDIVMRFAEHNAGKSKSTKDYTPVAIVYLNSYTGYVDARKIEKHIKNRGAYRFMNDLRFGAGERLGMIELRVFEKDTEEKPMENN